jgi:hypothetical protein
MAVLYSEESRKLLLKKSKMWNEEILILKTLKYILENKYLRTSEVYKDYAYFDKIRPEYILRELYKYNKKKFSFNPKYMKRGYTPVLYIRKVYKLLGAKVLYLDLKGDILYYSQFNNLDISYVNSKMAVKVKDVSKEKVLEKFENPDIIIINIFNVNLYKNNPPEHYKVPGDSPFYKIVTLDDKVRIKDMNFIQDSVLLGNWNKDKIGGGHAISGIKCKGKKYVYNGWVRETIDPNMYKLYLQNEFTQEDIEKERLWISEVIDNKIIYHNLRNDKVVDKLPADGKLISDNISVPCELMKYDWDVKKNKDFCINLPKCGLDIHSEESVKDIKDLCFSFNKGDRTIIYVNKNSVNDTKVKEKICPEGKVLNPITNRCVSINTINKLEKKTISKVDKTCPEGKVLNPKTGRCIKKENLIKKQKPEIKECPEGKVLNPKTGRCIKKENLIKKQKPEIKECPEGKVLNPKTGRCIKKENLIKKQKPEIKECPEGKVLNPKTGRCIKKGNLIKKQKTFVNM